MAIQPLFSTQMGVSSVTPVQVKDPRQQPAGAIAENRGLSVKDIFEQLEKKVIISNPNYFVVVFKKLLLL
jgi:cell division protein YceG involved in septum cleavage